MRIVGPGPLLPADAATKGYVDAAVAAAAPRIEQIILDFGAEETTAAGSVLAGWVSAGSLITCVPAPAGTDDHGAEDAILEGVTAVVTYLEPGIGFDVLAVCQGGTWGRYLFNCIQA